MEAKLEALIFAYKIIKELKEKAVLGSSEKRQLMDDMKYLATVILKHGGKI